MTIDCSVSATPAATVKGRTVPLPDSVIRPAPSSVVVAAIVFGVVRKIVTGLAPQENVIVPAAPSAVLSAASVQLPAEPVPTTASADASRAPARAAMSKAVATPRRVIGFRAVRRGRSCCQPTYGFAITIGGPGVCQGPRYPPRSPRATTLSSRIGFTPSKIGSTWASTT